MISDGGPTAAQAMSDPRPLSIPVILGTARKGRMSMRAARFIVGELAKRPALVTELIDVAELALPLDDAGESIKDPSFAAQMDRADALVIVSPEYNHSFPGLLKHVLDSCLKEYIHKAAGIVAVSTSSFGGARVVENLLPVLRELGLVAIFWDINFGKVASLFDDAGTLLDTSFVRRAEQFIDELVWMAKTLRHGREHIPLK
jgi:NAD(P)H-dependent FMN reductase